MYNHKFLQNTNVRLQTQSVRVRLAWCPLLPHLCRTLFSGGRRGVPTQGLLVSLLSLFLSLPHHSGSLSLLLSLVIDMQLSHCSLLNTEDWTEERGLI